MEFVLRERREEGREGGKRGEREGGMNGWREGGRRKEQGKVHRGGNNSWSTGH